MLLITGYKTITVTALYKCEMRPLDCNANSSLQERGYQLQMSEKKYLKKNEWT